jgi:hypothetical protein
MFGARPLVYRKLTLAQCLGISDGEILEAATALELRRPGEDYAVTIV